MRPFLLLARRREIANESRGGQLRHLLARGAANGEVRRDEADPLAIAELRGEPLEQGIGVRCVANFERPVGSLLADAVEDDYAARAFERHEARELVDELARVRERT